MRTLITGATGLVGSALVESLHTKGHDIRCLQRNENRAEQGIWKTRELFTRTDANDPFDTVIHLAGDNVAQGRWSNAKKSRIMASRVQGTRELVDYLRSLPTPPANFICASAIGFYGSRGDEELTEENSGGNGFLAEVCRSWEAEAKKAEIFGARVVHLRFGMVLSPNGGALHKMLLPFKTGLGGPIGDGQQFMSWVSIRDLVEIVDFTINTDSIAGPVNVVSPEAVTNKEFTRQLAKVVKRPAVLPAPPFALRLLFGDMADEMLLASSRVQPEKLQKSGYSFQDTDLFETLKYCVQGA